MASAVEKRLVEFIMEDRDNPKRFAQTAYPWGKGDLQGSDGQRKWQSEIHDVIGKHLQNPATRFTPLLISVASGHGIGKLHGYETIVPTPAGMRRWGDLKAGDFVFGVSGAAVEILEVAHHVDVPMYRVTFDDRSSCDVSSGHLWNVRGRQERRRGLETWRTLETVEILDLGVLRKNGVAMARQWEIPIQGAVEFDEREIDLHPYLMGVWLGDGHRGQNIYTKPFPEIADKIRSFGYSVTLRSDDKSYRIEGCADLFRDGVFDEGSSGRFIPDEYKFNTVENRKSLLSGLLDSDGEVGKDGSVGYSTTSRKLADDIVWLVRSVGGKAAIQPTVKNAWYTGKDGERINCKDCYRLTINLPYNPFTLEHRKERYRPSEARYLTRWISSIEKIENADGMCIKVAEPDGLYQANDFIVTHNSSEIGMVCHWAMSTCADCKIVVTANTENQLRTKTMPEITKWFRMSINAHWFNTSVTAITSVDKDHDRTWRLDAIPWSANNTEAFAGLHNQGRRIVLIFDEGSSIDDRVWEVAEGAMTDADTEIIWIVFGNPTKNSGRFRECFGRYKHRWVHKQIDSRTVEGTNKAQIATWAEDYGEDSDFFRVRVKGEFPRSGNMQFISGESVELARKREPVAKLHDPLVMGVDVARFGDDQSVICLRRGRDARSVPWVTLRGADTMQVAARVMELAGQWRPDAIFVDGGGVGGGVIDRLRMFKYNVIEVQFGGGADRAQMAESTVRYANKRAEMWGNMREWLQGGMIPDDPELAAQLTGVEYGYVLRDGVDAVLLEKKSDMKKRGLESPDLADALAISFAYPVMPSMHGAPYGSDNRSTHQVGYNPLDPAYVRGEGR